MAKGQSLTPKRRLAGLGFVAQSAVIAGALLVTYLVVAPLAFALSGSLGLEMALIAALACYAGAQFSLLLAALIRGEKNWMYRLGLGMTARAMFPLVLGTGLHLRHPEYADAGLIFYVLVFYLVTLVADTALLLGQTEPPKAAKKVPLRAPKQFPSLTPKKAQ